MNGRFLWMNSNMKGGAFPAAFIHTSTIRTGKHIHHSPPPKGRGGAITQQNVKREIHAFAVIKKAIFHGSLKISKGHFAGKWCVCAWSFPISFFICFFLFSCWFRFSGPSRFLRSFLWRRLFLWNKWRRKCGDLQSCLQFTWVITHLLRLSVRSPPPL